MASIINASTSGVGGVITTADNSGDLNIQSGGSTKIAVTSAGVAVTGLSKGSLPAGSVLQVVNATYSTYTSTSSATFSDTGLTATITPTSNTSKILVQICCNGVGKFVANTTVAFILIRNSTSILKIEEIAAYTASNAQNAIGSVSTTYLDSPATTSATTYKVQYANTAASSIVYLNSYINADGNTTSTITLMEIAA
jgi:hypothetical protein